MNSKFLLSSIRAYTPKFTVFSVKSQDQYSLGLLDDIFKQELSRINK